MTATPDVHVEPLNDAERDWITEHLGRLQAAGVDVGDDALHLGAYYDTLLTRWQAVPESRRTDPNPDITLIGLGLGAHLVRRTGIEWAVAHDSASTEIGPVRPAWRRPDLPDQCRGQALGQARDRIPSRVRRRHVTGDRPNTSSALLK